ncbi:MAG TPA: acylphosphatase [Candidatus Krumholzibacteria bacterium]|nr:acylphosphatase [Candidatus Krumholzibacteria bacterium]
MPRVEIRVRGRVQGVAFRHWTCREAARLGVTGWVRNEPDGSVRIVAEGDRAVLLQLAAWAARGPDHARVDSTEVAWADAAGSFTGFDVRG